MRTLKVKMPLIGQNKKKFNSWSFPLTGPSTRSGISHVFQRVSNMADSLQKVVNCCVAFLLDKIWSSYTWESFRIGTIAVSDSLVVIYSQFFFSGFQAEAEFICFTLDLWYGRENILKPVSYSRNPRPLILALQFYSCYWVTCQVYTCLHPILYL